MPHLSIVIRVFQHSRGVHDLSEYNNDTVSNQSQWPLNGCLNRMDPTIGNDQIRPSRDWCECVLAVGNSPNRGRGGMLSPGVYGGYRRSYAELIQIAIASSSNNQMGVRHIYSWFSTYVVMSHSYELVCSYESSPMTHLSDSYCYCI